MRSIPRFPCYTFCANGEVISHIGKKSRALRPIQMGAYKGFQLRKSDGQREKQYLHRLICEAYNGPCPGGMECRHLDGDKNNNCASNLAWGSKRQNEADKKWHGTTPEGEKNPMARLTAERVREMRARRDATGESYQKIACAFGVSTITAFRAITRKQWRNVK